MNRWFHNALSGNHPSRDCSLEREPAREVKLLQMTPQRVEKALGVEWRVRQATVSASDCGPTEVRFLPLAGGREAAGRCGSRPRVFLPSRLPSLSMEAAPLAEASSPGSRRPRPLATTR